VATDFGDEAATLWDSYFDLPKDSDARKQFKLDHPEMKLYTIAAFNPDEYSAAKELFSQEDLQAWTGVPAWDGTEETDKLRAEYWASNPSAFLVQSWMSGRPSEYGDDADYDEEKGKSFYDFGKDYSLASEKFGEDIWQIVALQKQLPDDKVARAQFYDQYPEYSEWADWWYGGNKDKYEGRSYGKRSGEGYDSLGHRAYGSWGGGGGGGWGGGGGGGGAYVPPVEMPYIQPRYMSSNLWEAPGATSHWRPNWIQQPDAPRLAPPERIIRSWG
jgi:hypothetical protein